MNSTTTTQRASPVEVLRRELDRFTIFAATAAFTLVAMASKTGAFHLPGGSMTLALFPVALLAIDGIWRHLASRNELRGAAAWSALVLVALTFTPALTRSTEVAVGLPIALTVSVVAARKPALTVVLVAATTAAMGSFQAFLGFAPGTAIDLLLVALWLAVIGRVVIGRPYAFVLWPAILGFALFAGISALDMVTSGNFALAYFGFKSTVWYMLTFVAIAYAGWSRETYRTIAFGIVCLVCLVCTYTVFRWVFGPAQAERDLAITAGNGINVEPISGDLRVVGSFQTTHTLAFWSALVGPFCFAVALWRTDRWRIFGAFGVVLSLVTIIASEVRGPLPGLIVGLLIVLAVHQGSRAFSGLSRGVVILLIASALGLGGGAVALASADPDRVERFETILNPGDDPAFAERQIKWAQVLDSVDQNPFGRGLGTASAAQEGTGRVVELSEFNIDSSYLKVAYEQGLPVMVLFIGVMLGLFASLLVASLRSSSGEAAALGMGAAGTLASMLVSFYTGLYIEAAPIVGAWLIIGVGVSYFVSRPRIDLERWR